MHAKEPYMTTIASPAMRADACGEVPFPDIVLYNTDRMDRIGYLERFAGYFRQLGLTEVEHRSLKGLDSRARAGVLERAGERAGWLADPGAHLRAAGCKLLLVAGECLPRSMGLASPDPERLLDRYAALETDVRLFVGVDPHDPASLQRALSLGSHPRCAGLSLLPFLDGIPLDHAAYAATLRAAAERRVPVWVHASAHFRPDVAYDIGHPRHIDAALMRHPGLRLIFGHAGWPWTDEACIVAQRHPSTALEFSTFPPSIIRDPAWSLSPLFANRAALRGRIFFGSGATSSPARFERLYRQLDEMGLGDDLAPWSGDALLTWLRGQEA